MMQWMHSLSRSWPALILMGGLTLSFIVWGVADIFTGQTSTAVATVGPVEISRNLFERRYRTFIRMQSQQTGKEITPEIAQAMGLGPAALQQIIGQTALDNEAAKLGLVTPETAVTNTIQTMPSFRGATGRFDKQTFDRLIQGAGYTAQGFFDDVRSEMTRAQLTGPVESWYTIPVGYAQALFTYVNERRAADYVVVTADTLPPIAPPDEKTLEAYVKANTARFSTPEYRDVEFAELGPEDLATQTPVTDAQIRQEFDARKAAYIVPEKRDVEQLPFANEADAKAALAKFKAGANFESLIQQRGFKAADISGTHTKAELPEGIAEAAFALPLNGVSEPVKSTFGYTLLHVTKIEAGSNKTFDDVKDEIRKALAVQTARGKLEDIANAFTDARSGGATIAQAAQKSGMKAGHVTAMDASGKGPEGNPVAAPQDPEFLARVASAEVGEDNDPFQNNDGKLYALKVNGVTPPKLKSLDQVRAEATAAWIAERRATLLAGRATELTKQAVKEKSLAGVATALKTTVRKSPSLSRQTSDATFSAALVKQLFEAKPDGIVSGPAGAPGSFIIARVTGIAHPPIDPRAPGFAEAAQQLSQAVASDFSNGMAAMLRERQGVKINQRMLESAIGGGS